MEEPVFFHSDGVTLEGLVEKRSAEKGVIVTHPHPLYGGDMNNFVVNSIIQAFGEKGYTTLRFNFRGVGASEGVYDNGDGEQKDVLAAIEILRGLGMKRVDLAGYSFGAWVNACLAGSGADIDALVMVSPPVGLLDFGAAPSLPCLKLVISGSRDEFAPVKLIQKKLDRWNPDAHFEVIDGADHFYSGYARELKSVMTSFL